eukprot:CAMPEP_0183512456 /NCGR_PEP_ID=MMETSP0371-20130417/11567_1 /TAXON_ID=268820 /ORGANISM="Peridinium aciculiferum, Strain PAER-2" /LENGTH=153 /DNA_ID=CAMNT_0025709531 /DNA_START=26 /DNA_END=487 /DNA_ORIENTATION=+
MSRVDEAASRPTAAHGEHRLQWSLGQRDVLEGCLKRPIVHSERETSKRTLQAPEVSLTMDVVALLQSQIASRPRKPGVLVPAATAAAAVDDPPWAPVAGTLEAKLQLRPLQAQPHDLQRPEVQGTPCHPQCAGDRQHRAPVFTIPKLRHDLAA